MIISDLQYIESATETEVRGGTYYCEPVYCKPVCYKPAYNVASATAGAEAFGKNTKAETSTGTKVISGQYSGSGSSSKSETW
jgi:hypothetical protein